jgi:hypothetical protein
MSSHETNGVLKDETKPRPKGSYPSKQQRFGAAPLASFEDLPSDDQQSPDDEDDDEEDVSLNGAVIRGARNVLDLDSSQLLHRRDSPGGQPALSPTLTITPTGCDRKSSDCLSQNTLTLGLVSRLLPQF